MQKKNKWIMYGATGVIGFGLLAGGASTVANAMELQTSSASIPGGVVSGNEVAASPAANKANSDENLTVVSIPSADSIDSTPSVDSVDSADSANSAPSVNSVDSSVSVPSVDSPQSADSVASADSI